MSGVRLGGVVLALALLGLSGCQNEKAGPAAADYEKQRAEIIARRQAGQAGQAAAGAQAAARPQGPAGPAAAGIGAVASDYSYDAKDKRDPFRSFVLDRLKELEAQAKGPLEQFDLNQLALHGVVWQSKRPRALVADPSGQVYIVREGDPIGTNSGAVMRIDDNLMLVRETYIDHMGEPTTKEVEMRVRRNQEG
jgi:Tfp pilus assembly protein PilP